MVRAHGVFVVGSLLVSCALILITGIASKTNAQLKGTVWGPDVKCSTGELEEGAECARNYSDCTGVPNTPPGSASVSQSQFQSLVAALYATVEPSYTEQPQSYITYTCKSGSCVATYGCDGVELKEPPKLPDGGTQPPPSQPPTTPNTTPSPIQLPGVSPPPSGGSGGTGNVPGGAVDDGTGPVELPPVIVDQGADVPPGTPGDTTSDSTHTVQPNGGGQGNGTGKGSEGNGGNGNPYRGGSTFPPFSSGSGLGSGASNAVVSFISGIFNLLSGFWGSGSGGGSVSSPVAAAPAPRAPRTAGAPPRTLPPPTNFPPPQAANTDTDPSPDLSEQVNRGVPTQPIPGPFVSSSLPTDVARILAELSQVVSPPQVTLAPPANVEAPTVLPVRGSAPTMPLPSPLRAVGVSAEAIRPLTHEEASQAFLSDTLTRLTTLVSGDSVTAADYVVARGIAEANVARTEAALDNRTTLERLGDWLGIRSSERIAYDTATARLSVLSSRYALAQGATTPVVVQSAQTAPAQVLTTPSSNAASFITNTLSTLGFANNSLPAPLNAGSFVSTITSFVQNWWTLLFS